MICTEEDNDLWLESLQNMSKNWLTVLRFIFQRDDVYFHKEMAGNVSSGVSSRRDQFGHVNSKEKDPRKSNVSFLHIDLYITYFA